MFWEPAGRLPAVFEVFASFPSCSFTLRDGHHIVQEKESMLEGSRKMDEREKQSWRRIWDHKTRQESHTCHTIEKMKSYLY